MTMTRAEDVMTGVPGQARMGEHSTAVRWPS